MFLIPMLIKYSLNDIREQWNWSKLVVYRSFWIERERDCWVFGGMNNSSIFPPSAFSALENKIQGSQILLLCCFQFLLSTGLLKNCWRPKVEMWFIPPSSPWRNGRVGERTSQSYRLDQPPVSPGEETVVLSSIETCGGGDKGSP